MRGDVHVLTVPKGAKGHEQRGTRFAVVVQSDLLPLSTWLVAPTSTRALPTLFRPEVVIEGRRTLVMTDQTAALDMQRIGTLVGHLTHAEMSAVDDALRDVLGLDD